MQLTAVFNESCVEAVIGYNQGKAQKSHRFQKESGNLWLFAVLCPIVENGSEIAVGIRKIFHGLEYGFGGIHIFIFNSF